MNLFMLAKTAVLGTLQEADIDVR